MKDRYDNSYARMALDDVTNRRRMDRMYAEQCDHQAAVRALIHEQVEQNAQIIAQNEQVICALKQLAALP